MKIVATVISLAYFAALAYVVVSWDHFSDALNRSAGEGAELRTVVVPAGAVARDVPEILTKAGVVSDPAPFQLYVDRFHIDKPIPAGEYAIAPSMSPVQQLARIESGQVVTYTVVVPAGAASEAVIETLAAEQLADLAELRRLANDQGLAGRLGIVGPTLEGFLFPDAYDLPRGLGAEVLLGKLVERFRSTVGAKVTEAAQAWHLSEYDVVTLASLVETAEIPAKERRFYAAVLLNRLKAAIPLQNTAALDYGDRRQKPATDDTKKRRRRRKKRAHGWDTMKVPGLPKTPICNPSAASVRAVANAAPVRAIYMVRRDDGTHVFCADLECYYAARRRWGPPLPVAPPPPPPDIETP